MMNVKCDGLFSSPNHCARFRKCFFSDPKQVSLSDVECSISIGNHTHFSLVGNHRLLQQPTLLDHDCLMNSVCIKSTDDDKVVILARF